MYYYRKLTLEEQQRILEDRIRKRHPWHSPPHREFRGRNQYLITSACYDHQSIIGESTERMSQCENELLNICKKTKAEIYAWCVLPNHYHILVKTDELKPLLKNLGQFHGRSSHQWNGEDNRRGRQCWCNSYERYIRSERHFWATLNYIHHNPVHHGYADKWQDWPWSSAEEFIKQNGRDEALRIWHEYPLLDYGKKWDIF